MSQDAQDIYSSSERNIQQGKSNSNIPENQQTLDVVLADCKRDIESIEFQIRPGLKRRGINDEDIYGFMKKLDHILDNIDQCPNNTDLLKNKKEDTYKKVKDAIHWLITAEQEYKAFEETHDRNTFKQFLDCLDDAYELLKKALKNFNLP